MKTILACCGLLFFTACATTSGLEYDEDLAFNARNYGLSAQLIQDKIESEEYTEKDRVLYSAELGTLYHLQGDYESSNRHFSESEDAIDQNYTKSVSRGLASFISNDNALVYDGEPYEDTYLNAFMALNYLHQDNLDGALVEARRVAYKLEQTAIKTKGMAEVIGNGDNPVFKVVGKDQINFELGELSIQASPFSHYLATIISAKMNKPDDARIEFTRLEEALNVHATQLYKPELRDITEQSLRETETYNTLLVGFSGRAPKKVGKKANIYLSLASLDFVYGYPELEIFEPVTQRVEVVVNGEETIEIPTVEHMDLVAAEVFNFKLPIIKTRALLRGAAKGVATDLLANQAKKWGGQWLGMAADILGSVAADASEQADTRSWSTLPGKVHANVVSLEPGTHQLTWNFYDAYNQLRYQKTEEITIGEGQPLTIAQSEFLR